MLGARGASAKARIRANSSHGIDDFFRDFTAEWIRIDPSLATSLRYFTGEEQDRLERQLTPLTIASARQRLQLARKGLAELRKFDRAGMTETQRVSADVMAWQLEMTVAEEPYWDYVFPLEQMNGWNVSAVEWFTVARPLAKPRDAENYVAALGQVSARMEEAIAESRRLAAKNVIPPRFILEATIKQMQSFVDPSPGQNPFVTAFADKMATVEAIPAAQREQLRAEAEKIVGTQIYPAWKKAAATLQAQLPRSTNDAGPVAAEGRTRSVRLFPAALHHDEPHRGSDSRNRIAAGVAHRDADGRAFAEVGPHGRAGEGANREAQARSAISQPDIGREPCANHARYRRNHPRRRKARRVIVRPAAEGAGGRAAVPAIPRGQCRRQLQSLRRPMAPVPARSRYPRRIEWMTRFGLRSVVYHETVPGHHFQIALQVENQDLPRFMQVRALGGISAIIEGWGLYAERLAAESGWYGDDIEGQLGQLDCELMRARRLVVDTGLHAKRWTRQQAIDYGIEASEVERYTVYPGPGVLLHDRRTEDFGAAG